MEIAKFVLTAIGTFGSVIGLSFAVFQHWRKRQDEKMVQLKTALEKTVGDESGNRKESEGILRKRIEKLEDAVSQRFESRLSTMEGELKGIRSSLQQISNWFIGNAGGNK